MYQSRYIIIHYPADACPFPSLRLLYSDMIAAGVLYMGTYVAMGFAKRLPVLVAGQLLIGFIAGR